MKATDYPMLIVWSEEDQAYLARVIDLPGCIADGTDPHEALANAVVVISEWIETAQQLGREVPKPSDDTAFRESLTEAVEQQQKEFEEAVTATAQEMVTELIPHIIAKYRERLEQRRHVFFTSPRKLSLVHS